MFHGSCILGTFLRWKSARALLGQDLASWDYPNTTRGNRMALAHIDVEIRRCCGCLGGGCPDNAIAWCLTAYGHIERGIPNWLRLTLVPSISVHASRSTTDFVESRYSVDVWRSILTSSKALMTSLALSVYAIPAVSVDLRKWDIPLMTSSYSLLSTGHA